MTKTALWTFCIVTIALTIIPWTTASDSELVACDRYEESWRVAKCAASQRETEEITDKLYATYLQIALSKVPSHSAYTSIGITTGLDKTLAVGKQSHYHFDAWSYKVKYDPRDYYFDRIMLAVRGRYQKPVLLYVTNLPDDVPQWKENFMSAMIPKGEGKELRLYRSATVSAITKDTVENCNNFYDWEQRESFEKAEGSAILMDAGMWCPTLRDSKFEIIVADIKQKTTADGLTFYQTTWETTKDGSEGQVPEDLQNSFF